MDLHVETFVGHQNNRLINKVLTNLKQGTLLVHLELKPEYD